MATVQPIVDKQHLKAAEQHIKQNFDPAYHLIYRIGIETGFRITDLTELKYSDIDTVSGNVTVEENKGTRARKARARLKVLEDVKKELIAATSDSKKMMKIYITPAKDVYSLVPSNMLASVDRRIGTAMANTPPKKRVARVSKGTLKMIKARYDRFNKISEGYLFARSTLASNRARNTEGVISRQACHKVFKTLTAVIGQLGEHVRVGCHSLRKIFARHLYNATNKDIGLLMRTIGHSSVAMSLNYIGITSDEEMTAADALHSYFEA